MLCNKLWKNYLKSTKDWKINLLLKHSSSYSQMQVKQMEENIILVDHDDNVIGPSTKRMCHERVASKSNDVNANGLLHRAFSVFLFNSRNELLLQQRSATKITFPNYFTNTCCSHPRYNKDEMHMDSGIKLAAQRRMEFELGIDKTQLPTDKYNFLTRIHYSAAADENWGEHEIDYVLFCRADVTLNNINSDEVQNTMFMNQKQLKRFLRDAKQHGILITPWFDYICRYMLFDWWDRLHDLTDASNNIIHRAGVRKLCV